MGMDLKYWGRWMRKKRGELIKTSTLNSLKIHGYFPRIIKKTLIKTK